MSQNASRNANLDVVRILACCAVVCLHTVMRDRSLWEKGVYFACGFAVPAFFAASGYVLLNREGVDERYAARKIGRLLCIAVGWNLLTCLLRLARDFSRGDFTLRYLLALPQALLGSLLQQGGLSNFWYLGAAMLVYACLPLLVRLRGWLTRIWAALVCAGVLFMAASCVVGEPLQGRITQTFRLWTWLQYFLLGGLLGGGALPVPLRRLERLGWKAHTLLLAVVTAAVVLWQCLLGKYLIHTLWAEHFYDSLSDILWLIVLFTWAMKLPLSAKAALRIRRLSSLTLGIYVTHALVIQGIMRPLVARAHGLENSPTRFLGTLLFSALATWLLSKIPVLRKLV